MKPKLNKSKSWENKQNSVLDEKLKPFQDLLSEANGSEEILNLINRKIMSIFITEFEEKFSTILQSDSKNFMETLNFRVTRILEDMYKISISDYQEIENLIISSSEIVKKDKYLPQYNLLTNKYSYYSEILYPVRKIFSKTIEVVPFLKKFRRHCKDTLGAFHKCGDKFIEICENDELNSVSHVMCVRCKVAYLAASIEMWCDCCDIDYFSCVTLSSDSKLEAATWKKYHCGAIINDKMRCIKCKEVFFINCETGMLECQPCNLEIPPLNIQWTCMICKSEFTCEAKVYNPLEYKNIKTAIKEAIIHRELAKPDILTCCNQLDLNSVSFEHKKDCLGQLYIGELNLKKIVVCSICKSMNFYDKFIWTCPNCGKKFKLKNDNSANKNNSYDHRDSNEKNKDRLPRNEKGDDFVKINPTPIRGMSASKNQLVKGDLIQINKNRSESKIMPFIPRNIRASPNPQRLSRNDQIPDCNLSGVKKSLVSSFNDINLERKNTESHSNSKNIYQKPSKLVLNNIDHQQYMNNLENYNTEEKFKFHFDIDDFEIITCIGEGSYGKIYKVEHKKNKRRYGLKKIIAHSEKEVEEFQREYEIMNWVTIDKHCEENILNILGVTVKKLDSTTTAVYVLMELADSDWEKEINSRARYRNYYKEEELINILNLIVKTLAILEKENISHRDIKPQNILIFREKIGQNFENKYKLADFGEAKELIHRDTKSNTLRGTELYMSPILFSSLQNHMDGPESKIKHNPFKSDVFSLGLCVLLASTLTFKSLYDIRELVEMKQISIIVRKYLYPRYTEKLIKLILLMLQVDEKKRPNFFELTSYFD